MSEHFLYIVTKISLSLADIVKQSHCILKDRVHVQFLGYKHVHVYVWVFFSISCFKTNPTLNIDKTGMA